MSRIYDLQVHTDASPCSATSPDRVVRAAIKAGLDGIAITDHDTVTNVDTVRAAAPDDLEVISATEVTTSQGHLLALGIEHAPSQSDPLTVIDEVHDLGGVAVLSHPFDKLRQYYDSNLDSIAGAVDGVEIINSRCIFERYNEQAKIFADEYGVSVTGGSDAHFPMELGRAVTVVEGDQSILDAIRAGETRAEGRGRFLSGHVATKLNEYTPWPWRNL